MGDLTTVMRGEGRTRSPQLFARTAQRHSTAEGAMTFWND